MDSNPYTSHKPYGIGLYHMPIYALYDDYPLNWDALPVCHGTMGFPRSTGRGCWSASVAKPSRSKWKLERLERHPVGPPFYVVESCWIPMICWNTHMKTCQWVRILDDMSWMSWTPIMAAFNRTAEIERIFSWKIWDSKRIRNKEQL